MILLQNPNMPVPTNAVEIDAAILDIKAHLEAGLTWLTNGYGRTYKNLDATNGTTVFYPEAYLGEQNNSHRYINLSPDNDKQGQCFFYVTKENISQFQPGMYSFLSYDTAIIFSVNMELINDALLQTEIYQQILVAQVRDVLTRQLLGASYQLSITSVDFLFENVYSEFDLADAHQLEKAPLSHFRFNCNIQLPETCPTPSIIPPVTSCYSLLLDGVNEYIDCTNNVAFDFDGTDSFTISGWIKKTSSTHFPILAKISFPSLTVVDGYRCYIHPTLNVVVVNLYGTGSGSISVLTVNPIAINTWQNITATYDGSETAAGVNIYVDGVLQALTVISDTYTGTMINGEKVTIGGQPTATNPIYGTGNIASVRMWNTELTSVQVAAEYNGGTILNPAVQGVNLVLETDINNATFGTEWNIPDTSGITAGYTSVNMEVGDRVEDCPT